MSDSSDEEDTQINFPSQKLGAITRVRNKITDLMKDKANKEAVSTLFVKMQEKIKNFETACNKEKEKSGLQEEKESLIEWMDRNKSEYTFQLIKIEAWITNPTSENTENVDNTTEDSDDGRSSSAAGEETSMAQILGALLKNQTISKLPNNEPTTFSGEDITEYQPFMLSFERLIENNAETYEDKYHYLLKYTKGEARELVYSCHNSNAKIAFKNAKKMLLESYGNHYLIAQKYLDRLLNWPQIKSEDHKELNKFALFLTTCLNMMDKMTALNQLNSWRDIKDILMKLPWDIRKQFRSIAQRKMEKNEEVTFRTLVKFVNEQSKIMNLPLLGDICDKKPKSKQYEKPEKAHKNFYAKEAKEKNELEPCDCCKKTNHVLDSCKFFLKKPLEDRKEFVNKKNLCYGCLKRGHRSKDCTRKLTCKRCEKKHPTSLHYDQKKTEIDNEGNKTLVKDEETENRAVSMSTRNNVRTACPAIPVIIRNKDNNELVTTYAALDNFSTSCYMDEALMNVLKIEGIESSISITTIEGQTEKMNVCVVENLEIRSIADNNSVVIPKIYAKKNWPFTLDDSPKKADLENIPQLKDVPFQFIDKPIGVLIGMNVPELIKPIEILTSTKKGPYASRHILGWALNGPVKGTSATSSCFRIKENDMQQLENKFNKAFSSDFDISNDDKEYSVDEKNWLEFVENNTIKQPNNQLQISLPFKTDATLPNNYSQVHHRLISLVKKLKNDDELHQEYCQFMKTMVERDFMEEVPDSEITPSNGKCYYLTHHGVMHKQKKKLRVVFDCSLKHQGVSLNDCLWKGPDLANTLVGVLLRFRQEKIAISGDIEKMFYMIRLPREDRDYLRLLWFENNDINKEPKIFRMKVHIFGATSSPAVANFALKKSLEERETTEQTCVTSSAFYVDDMMKSFKDNDTAISAMDEVQKILQSNGFNLTAFSSNSRELLNSFPKEKLSRQVENVSLIDDELPQERTLGIIWKTEKDTLGYDVNLPDQPSTKRGVLSTLSSVYDPLFIASPAVIKAKRMFQICCHLKMDWDSPLPSQYDAMWQHWKEEIYKLNEFEVPRCYKRTEDLIINTQLHIFADGSEVAYGAVAYLRQEDYSGEVSTSIVMAKARLTPINKASLKTTPRIELNAAKLAVILHEQLKKEFKTHIHIDQVFYWTDSLAVLRYILSDTGHFQTFVANRVAYIRSLTDTKQWRSVPGKQNPADLLSRGANDIQQLTSNQLWLEGPEFIKDHESKWPLMNINLQVKQDDPELKKRSHCFAVNNDVEDNDPTSKLLKSTSDLRKMKIRVAVMLRLKQILRKKILDKKAIETDDLNEAEKIIWKHCQQKKFPEIYCALKRQTTLPKNNVLRKLNLFLDEHDLIRVGGRLCNAPLQYSTKHPILLHCDSHPVQVLATQCHRNLGHMGKATTSTELRRRFHIVKENKLLKRIVGRCVICKKVQGKPSNQIMADLPSDRLTLDLPPFTNTATDLFGPFFVTKGNKQEKRYGVIFSCLSSRATHIEITPSLDTDSYINALRRFIARRGIPKTMLSDNGSNLTASNKELKTAIKDWNTAKINQYCQQEEIEWKFQPPYASHFGGVFERQIRTIRKIFCSMLREVNNLIKLNDDVLNTLFCEIENILNSRPLTAVITNEENVEPLTPNHILRLSLKCDLPPGLFERKDIYLKRRWRQAQYISEVFWHRFRDEYLTLLQQRAKWTTEQRCHREGDIVLIVEDGVPRNQWPMGVISEVKKSNDGKVRSANIKTLRNKYGNKDTTTINRAITKLVLLCPYEET